MRVGALHALHGVVAAEESRQPRDMRIDRGIAILDRVAVALGLEDAPRLAVDAAEDRGLDDRPRLTAELVVDAARAAGNRGEERREPLRGRSVGEPWLPHRAEPAGLLLDQARDEPLVGD
ncbi:MAG: hypothetical protein ACK56F_28555, partial [bacterium]